MRLRRCVEWVAVAILPVVLFLAYGFQRFYVLSGADPFIYTGYAVSPSDVIERLGYPYYAVRFGLIIPSNLFSEAFGVVPGYFALRWFLAFIAAGVLFQLLRSRFRWEIGAIGALALLLNPIFIRALMTMYSTTVGVPMIAAAAALLLMPGSSHYIATYRVLAGAMLGITVHSNPFTALPIGAMVLVWVYARASVGRRRAVREIALVGVGGAVVTAIGVGVYWIRFGDPDIISPSFNTARSLSSGQFPGTELDLRWLNFRPEVWLAPISSLVLFVSIRLAARPPHWYEKAALLIPAAMWGSFAFHEFVLGGYTLETYYYSSYLFGPTALAFMVALHIFAEHFTRNRPVDFLLLGGLVLSIPLVWTHQLQQLSVWTLNGVIPMLVVFATLVVLSVKWHPAALALSGWICIVPFMFTLGSPRDVPLSPGQPFRQEARYLDVYNNTDNAGLDLFALAADVALSTPRTRREPGSVVFWFPSDEYNTGLAQWTYLGPYTTLQSGQSLRLPGLSRADAELLTSRTPRFLIVLSSDEAKVSRAEERLDRLELRSVGRERMFIEHGDLQLHLSVNEYIPSKCDLSQQGEPVLWTDRAPCRD